MLTDLADVLRDAGLTVKEMPGWQTRGVNGWGINGPFGGLVHHTGTAAAAAGDYPSLKVVRGGRSDLQGPLAQLGLGRSGVWYVIAAGYCNHAGPVDDPDYSNPRALGVECENPGGTAPWPAVQRESLTIGCRALGDHYGIRWRGHKEAAVPHGRKVDPNLDMTKLRREIAAYRATPSTDDFLEDLMAKVTFVDANEMTNLMAQGVSKAEARKKATVTYPDGTAALAGALNFLSSALRDLAAVKADVAALKMGTKA